MAFGQSATSSMPSSNGGRYSVDVGLLITPFHLVVGPERHQAMVHKELLCSRSPVMHRLCQKSSEVNRHHGLLADMLETLKGVTTGPASNLQDEMIAALRTVLQKVSNDLFRELQDGIARSMEINCKTQKSGSLEFPGEGSYTDWVCLKLGTFKSIQVRKVVQSAQAVVSRTLGEDQKSVDPGNTVRHDKLYLPNSTVPAANILVGFLYAGHLPEARSGEDEALLTLCHVNALAVQLELCELANHCIDVLVCVPELLVEAPLAAVICKQAQFQSTNKSWHRLRRLLLDILAAPDTLTLSDDQLDKVMGVLGTLDQAPLRHVAKNAIKRNTQLARFHETTCRAHLSSAQPVLKTDSQEADKRPTTQEESPSSDFGTLKCPSAFSDPVTVCRRYHLHPAGEGCFPDTKQVLATPAPTPTTIAPIVDTTTAVKKSETPDPLTSQPTSLFNPDPSSSQTTSPFNSHAPSEVSVADVDHADGSKKRKRPVTDDDEYVPKEEQGGDN